MLPEIQQLRPASPEQNLPEASPEVEGIEAGIAEQNLTLDFFYLFDLLLPELVSEAYENQQAEHGVGEVIENRDRAGLVFQAGDEGFQNPVAGAGKGFDSRRIENFASKVAAEEPPVGAVDAGADVLLVAADDSVGERRRGAVGEDGAVLD